MPDKTGFFYWRGSLRPGTVDGGRGPLLRIELQRLYMIAADRRERSFFNVLERPYIDGLQLANIPILTGPEKAKIKPFKRFSAVLEKQRGAAWIVKNRRLTYKAQKGC
jgi:hypothetical protein